MTNRATLTAAQETGLWLPVRGERMFAIVTDPDPSSGPVGFVNLQGLPNISSAHRNRMAAVLARRLAAKGIYCARLDWLGVGESSGTLEDFSAASASEFSLDVDRVIEQLELRGARRTILAGTCFGGVCALHTASRLGRRVAGVAMVSPLIATGDRGEGLASGRPADRRVSDYLRQEVRLSTLRSLLNPDERRRHAGLALAQTTALSYRLKRRLAGRPADGQEPVWVNQSFLESLESTLRDRLPVLMVFSEGDDFYRDFLDALNTTRLRRIIEQASSLVEVVTVPGRGYIYNLVERQESVMDLLANWVARVAGAN